VRYEKARTFAVKKVSTVLVVGCVVAAVFMYPTAYSSVALLLLTLAFMLVAGGNTVMGIFTHHTSRVLGEMAYGIYLLHGILLFLVFRFLFGYSQSSELSPVEHWTVVCLCTPILILTAFFAFRCIELPGMRLTSKAVIWVDTYRIVITQFISGLRR
jgi:peptidoglycan/LPS O-acetylase OafA/YrhL